MSKNTLKRSDHSIIVSLEVALFQEDEMWVAYCPALEVSSYGENQEDARKAFDEAMQIFLSETIRKGTLERYLLRLGWQLQQKPIPVYKQPYLSLHDNQRLVQKSPEFYHESVAIPVA